MKAEYIFFSHGYHVFRVMGDIVLCRTKQVPKLYKSHTHYSCQLYIPNVSTEVVDVYVHPEMFEAAAVNAIVKDYAAQQYIGQSVHITKLEPHEG